MTATTRSWHLGKGVAIPPHVQVFLVDGDPAS
jgi:hypothetical protein